MPLQQYRARGRWARDACLGVADLLAARQRLAASSGGPASIAGSIPALLAAAQGRHRPRGAATVLYRLAQAEDLV